LSPAWLGLVVCELSDVELRELEELLEAAAKSAAERAPAKRRVTVPLMEPSPAGPEMVSAEST
jgi:hypothetical protein